MRRRDRPGACAAPFDVLIEDCVFDTTDDNLAIKAGRDRDAWGGRARENIVIRRGRGGEAREYPAGSSPATCASTGQQ